MSRGDVLGLAAVSHAADPEAIARALGLTPAEVAAILFPVVATEDVDGAPRWVVTLAVRRRVLAWDRGADGALVATGQPAVARWVALAGPARGPTETLLRAWLAGRLTDVPQQVRKRPDELRRVATWLADCAWVTPPPREILARLAVEELRRRCHDVASASFVGRDDVLGWMRDRLAHPPRTVVIEGGGGLGKSALLATFVLGAGAYQPGGPIALFLDFDDPVRTVARPDLLHAELARQAAIQAPALDGIARELAATAASNSRAAREDDGPPDEAIARDGRAASLADYLFAELERVGRPSYLVVDTLERARHAAPALLEERLVFWRNQVASRPGQHLIVAGRGPLDLAALADAPRWPLRPLVRDAAAKLLAELLKGQGVPPAQHHRILDRLGRDGTTPLNLRLCARAVATLTLDEVDDERLDRALREARVAGYLQRRIIDHLPSARLAEVARLAIHLPVITPAALAAIVGPLVTPPIADLPEAERLFDELARVVDLVGQVAGGAQELRLRPEVADELRDLALDDDAARVVALLERALATLGDDRAGERPALEAALIVARRRRGGMTQAVGPTTGTRAIAVERAVAALRELLAAGRLTEAVDQGGLLADDLLDAGLLVDLARAALSLGAWLRAEAFATHAIDRAGAPVRRALGRVLLARALAGLPTGERPDGATAATAARHLARVDLDGLAVTDGAAAERAEVLVELAVDDRAWAQAALRELGAARRWTSLAGVAVPLLRAIAALAATRDALDWAAEFGGFDGETPGPDLAGVAGVVADEPALRAALASTSADLPPDRVDAIVAELSARRRAGELGRLVRRWLVVVDDAHPLIPALAAVLDERRPAATRSTASAAERAARLTTLGDAVTKRFDAVGWRALVDELGDRRLVRRATSDDVGLAVRATLVEIDRLRRGDALIAALERRGFDEPAALARSTFFDDATTADPDDR